MTNTKKATKQDEVKQDEVKQDEVKQDEVKITALSRRDEMMKAIKLNERMQFETAETAINSKDSAMITCDNAIMITLVSTESKKASRVLEIWAHKKRCDLCISKKLLNSLLDTQKENEKIQSLKNLIDEKHSKSKFVLKVCNDDRKQLDIDTIDIVNALLEVI